MDNKELNGELMGEIRLILDGISEMIRTAKNIKDEELEKRLNAQRNTFDKEVHQYLLDKFEETYYTPCDD